MALVFLLSVSVGFGQEHDTRSTIEGTIAELIKHLRAKQFSDVIRNFTTPENLQEWLKQATLEKIVASAIAKGDFDRLLTACEQASRLKPQLSATGTMAVFEYLDSDGKKATLGLQRVKNRWYLL